MFIRFRQAGRRLQLSIIETNRQGDRVRHTHVASLGSIVTPPSVAERVAFWARLHDRLVRLSNHMDHETMGKLLGAVHSRVPMPTPDEQRGLQIENAEAEARNWSTLRDVSASTIEGHKGLIATAERAVANGERAVADADERVTAAKSRVERIRNGEAVSGGLGRPVPLKDILADAGWTRSDMQHATRLAMLNGAAVDEFVSRVMKRQRSFEKSLSRRMVFERLYVKDDGTIVYRAGSDGDEIPMAIA